LGKRKKEKGKGKMRRGESENERKGKMHILEMVKLCVLGSWWQIFFRKRKGLPDAGGKR